MLHLNFLNFTVTLKRTDQYIIIALIFQTEKTMCETFHVPELGETDVTL